MTGFCHDFTKRFEMLDYVHKAQKKNAPPAKGLQSVLLLILTINTCTLHGEAINSIYVGATRDHPVYSTIGSHRSGTILPTVGYRYTRDADWQLGMYSDFKELNPKEDDSTRIVVWSFSQEITYQVRVYHPFYLAIGARTGYLLPVQKRTPPFRKEREIPPEISVSCVANFEYRLTERFTITLHGERWRGVRTSKLHGIGIGIGLSLNLFDR